LNRGSGPANLNQDRAGPDFGNYVLQLASRPAGPEPASFEMIRLTKQTDYGIVLMSQIAAAHSGALHSGVRHSAVRHSAVRHSAVRHSAVRHSAQFTAQELAVETHLPFPMVSKILKALTRAGLLVSQRGAKGGYALAQPPAEITVAAIIAALEGPIAITECVEESEDACSYEAICRVRGNWQRINQAVSDALAGITLEEMAEPWKQRSQVPVVLRRDPATGEESREALVSIGA